MNTLNTPHRKQRGLRMLVAATSALALAASGFVATAPSAFADDPVASTNWLEGYFNNIGIGEAGNSYADIDGMGSYIVRSGGGVAPNVTHEIADTDLTFSISGGVSGAPDNLAATGQTIDTTRGLGSLAATPATQIAFVGAATNGSKTLGVTLNYSDGSTQQINALLGDWCDSDPQGTNVRIGTWPERWYSGSVQQLNCGLWRTEVYTLTPDDPDATLELITVGNQPNFHIFAIASDAEIDTDAITLQAVGSLTLGSEVQYGDSVSVTAAGSLTWETGTGDPVTPDNVRYVWQTDGTTVAITDTPQYAVQAADAGKTLRVTAVGIAPGFVAGSAQSNTMNVLKGTFNATTAPVLNSPAQPRVGDALSVSTPQYSFSGVLTRDQWFADGNPVTGATGANYTLAANQQGTEVSVRVTATRLGYEDLVLTLNAPAEVAPGLLTTTAPATISGSFTTDELLSVTPGTYNVTATESYRWLADGAAIDGATASSYRVTADKVGAEISVEVTATRAGYETVSYVVAGTVVSEGQITTVSAPIVGTNPVVGQQIAVTPGEYLPVGATLTYQWLVNSIAVSGATGSSYTPAVADLNKQLQVEITVSADGYDSKTARLTAGTVAAATFTATIRPSLTGTAQVDRAITVNSGAYSISGVTLSYRWLSNGATIAGATSATFAPRASDHKRGLSVVVTASAPGYTSVTNTTNVLTVHAGQIRVTKKPQLKRGKKKVTKKRTVKVGQKLKATKGKYSASGVKLKYRWFVGKKQVKGKKGAKQTYKIRKGNAKKRISVRVTVNKAGYKKIQVKSIKTKKVKR